MEDSHDKYVGASASQGLFAIQKIDMGIHKVKAKPYGGTPRGVGSWQVITTADRHQAILKTSSL